MTHGSWTHPETIASMVGRRIKVVREPTEFEKGLLAGVACPMIELDDGTVIAVYSDQEGNAGGSLVLFLDRVPDGDGGVKKRV